MYPQPVGRTRLYIYIHVLLVTLGLTALTIKVAGTSETSVNFYQSTRCVNPEHGHLQCFIYELHELLTLMVQFCIVQSL
jgi:hypothetical protein